jgi:hypothetical protein
MPYFLAAAITTFKEGSDRQQQKRPIDNSKRAERSTGLLTTARNGLYTKQGIRPYSANNQFGAYMNFFLVLIAASLISGMVWFVADGWDQRHGTTERILAMRTRNRALLEERAMYHEVAVESIMIADGIVACAKTTFAIILLWLII